MGFSFYFYFADAHCPLSNCYPADFELDGQLWPTVTHYLEAQRVSNLELKQPIRLAPDAASATNLAKRGSAREDWNAVRDDVMRRALDAKFRQNAECRAFLLNTRETDLVENAPWEYYWGCGADGRGRNRTGELLMELRLTLEHERPSPVLRPPTAATSSEAKAAGRSAS